MIALWVYFAVVIPLLLSLWVLAQQRSRLTTERDAYRAALWQADPEQAREVSARLRVRLQ